MTHVFNAIHYQHELTEAGVAPVQAAVHARAHGHVLSEVAFCKDLNAVESHLRDDIGQSEQRLTLRIEAVHNELNVKIDKLETRLTAVERELTMHRWLFGLVIRCKWRPSLW